MTKKMQLEKNLKLRGGLNTILINHRVGMILEQFLVIPHNFKLGIHRQKEEGIV